MLRDFFSILGSSDFIYFQFLNYFYAKLSPVFSNKLGSINILIQNEISLRLIASFFIPFGRRIVHFKEPSRIYFMYSFCCLCIASYVLMFNNAYEAFYIQDKLRNIEDLNVYFFFKSKFRK